MIDAKQAVVLARLHASEFLQSETATLEEIERETYGNRDVWSITVGVIEKSPVLEEPGSLGAIVQTTFPRRQLRYKRILIDVASGEFVAMKMREVAA